MLLWVGYEKDYRRLFLELNNFGQYPIQYLHVHGAQAAKAAVVVAKGWSCVTRHMTSTIIDHCSSFHSWTSGHEHLEQDTGRCI